MKKTLLFFLLLLCLQTAASADTYLNALRLFNQHRFSRAAALFERVVEEKSLLADYAQFYLAAIQEQKNNPEQALIDYQKVADAYPDSILTHEATLRIANILYKKSELLKAADYYEKISWYPLAKLRLGSIYKQWGSWDRAAEYFSDIVVHFPDDKNYRQARKELIALNKSALTPSHLFERGLYYFSNHRYAEASDDFRVLIRYYPQDELSDNALLMLGRCLLVRGRFAAAIENFDYCISYRGDAADEAFFWKGRAYGRLGKIEVAISTFSKMAQLYPGSSILDEAQYYLGYYYEAKDEPGLALSAYWPLVERFPQSELMDVVLWRIGELYCDQGSFQSAAAAYKKLAEERPRSDLAAEALFRQAKAEEKLGRMESSRNTYQLLASRYARSYYGYRAKEILGHQGVMLVQSEEASERRLPNLQTENIHVKKCSKFIELGLADSAIKEAQAAILQDGSLRSKAALSRAYFCAGKYSAAISNIEDEYKTLINEGCSADINQELLKISFPTPYAYYVFSYSQKYKVDPYLMFALIREESRFTSYAKSWARARGLTQIIPSTGRTIARKLRIARFRPAKLFQEKTSIRMGTYHLAVLLREFKGDRVLALASYNAGSGNVKKWIRKFGYQDADEFVEKIPFKETRNYVKKVLRSYFEYKTIYIDEMADNGVY